MHVVQRADAPSYGAQQGASGPGNSAQSLGQTASSTGAPPSPAGPAIDPEERLQDFVIALLLRAGPADVWPEHHDFVSPVHRAMLEQLRGGPPWPDVPTAIFRLHETLGGAVSETLERVQARDEENERLSPEEVLRELDVRRLELRKHNLFRQTEALHSALKEEGDGLSAAERHESKERLRHLAASINETIVEQQRLGVVGTASWSIRRGQEVLGG
jgi:hypothetical protein